MVTGVPGVGARAGATGALPTAARGVAQLGRYLDTVGLDHGWLVVFDVRPDQPWEARLWTATHEVDGKRVVVLGA